MVRDFPVKGWGGLVVGGDVVYHFAYFLLSLGLVSHSYFMLYGVTDYVPVEIDGF